MLEELVIYLDSSLFLIYSKFFIIRRIGACIKTDIQRFFDLLSWWIFFSYKLRFYRYTNSRNMTISDHKGNEQLQSTGVSLMFVFLRHLCDVFNWPAEKENWDSKGAVWRPMCYLIFPLNSLYYKKVYVYVLVHVYVL